MSGTSQYTRARMVVDLDLPREIEWPIVSGKALPRQPPTFFARVKQAPRIDDIPWCIPLIVSHKVRDIMMDIDGKHLKVYPLRLDRSVGVRYCVVHCLRIVSCQVPPEAKGLSSWGLNPVVIDPSRVPKKTHVFHPRALVTMLVVSDVMRDAILEAKCTGGVFRPSQQWPLDRSWQPLSW